MPPTRRKTSPTSAGKQSAGKQSEQTEAPATRSTRRPRSIYIDDELLNRARAAATYLSSYVPEAGIGSLSDIVEPGLRAEVERLEKEHNKGKPFREVAKMPTGRPRMQ
jgi:post-segregation antitoxin (ccd killing protein)